jgi:hypothetical protein
MWWRLIRLIRPALADLLNSLGQLLELPAQRIDLFPLARERIVEFIDHLLLMDITHLECVETRSQHCDVVHDEGPRSDTATMRPVPQNA